MAKRKVAVKKSVKKKIVKKVLAKPKKKILVAKKHIKKSVKKKVIKKKILTKKIVKKIIKKKVVKPVVHRTKHKKQDIKIEEFPAESLFKAKIKVIGVGGGGGSIVSEIGRSLQKATFVVADTDTRALKKKNGIKYFCFGQELTRGLGTGVNVDIAKQSAENAKEKIAGIFKNQDIVIFIASLGGGLGSGATKVFAEVAKESGAITLGIFTTPFKFEGAVKHRIAQNSLKALRQALNVSLVIPNEKIFKVISENTAITDAFSMVNKSLVESLESLIDLIYSPGIINIDFADLRAILSGIGNSAFLNTLEESGKDRAEKICEKILVNPLLQNSSFDVEKILLNVAGSGNLSMLEVEKISRKIGELHPKSKIIFGISKNPKLKNKIKTTILMTGGASAQAENEQREIEKEIVKQEKIAEKAKEVAKKETEKKEVKKKVVNKKSKPKIKKPKADKKPAKKKPEIKKEKIEPVSIPVFVEQVPEMVTLDERRINIIEEPAVPIKTAIRRSGLEIRKAEELEEKKRQQQEKEWEIPAFLRKRPS